MNRRALVVVALLLTCAVSASPRLTTNHADQIADGGDSDVMQPQHVEREGLHLPNVVGMGHGDPNVAEVTAAGSTKARKLRDRWADVVNVLDFGADPDGSTDSSAAIRTAVAVAGGRPVFIPRGTYLVSAVIASGKNGVTITGAGRGQTILKTSGSTKRALELTGDDVRVAHLTVDGSSTKDGDTAVALLSLIGVDRGSFEDLEVHDSGYYGINPYECNDSVFKDLWLHDNYRHGIHPGADHVGRNLRNTYRNIYAWNSRISGGFDDRGSSVDRYAQSNNTYDGIYAWNNGPNKGGIAISMQAGITATNLHAWGNAYDGLFLYQLSDFSISNVRAYDNGFNGIYAESAYDGSLHSLVMTANARAKPTKGDGIEFNKGASDVKVSNVSLRGSHAGFIHRRWSDLHPGRTGKVYYSSITYDTATPYVWDGTVSPGQVVRQGSMTVSDGVQTYRSEVADGASAVAHRFTNSKSLRANGAKIASFCRDDEMTERAYIEADGTYVTGAGAVKAGSGFQVTANSLPTCSERNEGRIVRQSGGRSGARTKLCLCTSDGDSSPTYSWQNIAAPDRVGSDTTCP